MTRFGYTLMTEQSGPKDLVRYAVAAEQAGFDFEVSSDHYFPWLSAQGHAPYAWTVLGAVAQATERVELMTYVTCPTMRYHPAVVAQKAATLQLLADGRFTLGLGSGENLNEHVVGAGLAGVVRRQDMLARRSRSSASCTPASWSTARASTSRSTPRGSGTSPRSRCRSRRRCPGTVGQRFAPLADHLVAVEPDEDSRSWHDARRATGAAGRSRAIGQIPICWDPDRERRSRRHEQFRWFAGGWSVNADLPTTAGFDGATPVRPPRTWPIDPVRPRPRRDRRGRQPYWEAGFTDVALVQIGDDTQDAVPDEAAGPLLDKLRSASH